MLQTNDGAAIHVDGRHGSCLARRRFLCQGPGRLQAAHHVHALLTVLLEEAPWFPVHLIQRPSIRPLPLRLSFTSRATVSLCFRALGGLLALDVSHASCRVTICF